MIVKQIIEFGCGCSLTKRARTSGRKFTKFDHRDKSKVKTLAVCSIVTTTLVPGDETKSIAPPIPFTILP